ncbi:hypothetical protein [Nocardioides hwasunensis]|uniref:Serine protease n=1 Tax=Nocardioides hwasunensis TaxID=397258 RepID=A0ABR8ME22_9ACTN|nr:hypothetical protein [Nocardioides hwasunensis]MBD3914367.1 hypothetical protein [Nocardioides hwasunensis]
MRTPTKLLASAAGLALTGALATTAGTAAAAPTVAWAPAGSAAITPGVQTNTAGSGQCTANFVLTDAAGSVYVGQAAHCSGLGEATDTDGCTAGALPLGTRVTFNRNGSIVSPGTQVGAGTLAYSSWNTMQARGESDASTCAYNDFALVKVDAADVDKVNPTIPFWGGPVGINTAGTATGDRVFSFGNSGLRGGIEQLSPKTGVSLGQDAADHGWTHPLYTITPGIPGDSGSAFLDAGGNAVGTLSTLGLAPLPASNNIGDFSRELAYAQQHSGIAGLQLALGTEPFRPVL